MIYQHLFQAELFYDFYKDFLLKYTLPMHITYIKKKKKRESGNARIRYACTTLIQSMW